MTEQSKTLNVEQQHRLRRRVARLEALLSGYKHAKSVQYALLQLSELASSVTKMDVFYRAMHGVIGQLLNAKNFYVVLVCDQSNCYVPVYFSDQTDQTDITQLQSCNFENGLTGYVYRTGQSLLVDQQVYQDLLNKKELEAHGAAASYWMGVPLKRSHKVIGVVAVQTYDDNRYSENDQELLEFMSLHLVTAIDRVQQRELLEQSVRNRTRELSQLNHELQIEIKERQRAEQLQSALFKISQITANSAPMVVFYQSIHEVLKTLIYAENCYIALLSEDGKQLSFPFFADAKRQSAEPRKLGRGLTEYVIKKGKACLVDKVQAEALVMEGVICRRQQDQMGIYTLSTSWLGAPLIINDRVIGVVTTQAYEYAHEYNHKDLDVLCFVSHHLAVAIQRKLANDQLRKSYDDLESKIHTRTQELRQSNLFLKLQIEERKKAEEKLYHEANHDTLTNLPNRKLLAQRLGQAISHKKRHKAHHFAVLFIDLDRFKIINDTMGHHVGDKFLIEVSLRIAGCIRDNDVLARLGGDEFVILLDMINSIDDAEEIAQRIITSLARPFYMNKQEVYSGASIGIAECNENYLNADDLLRDADAAMYQAKGMGRGRFIVFDETMHQRLVDDMNIDQALHHAVKDRLIFPAYMTIYQTDSGQPIGVEVQTSWHHPALSDVERPYFNQLAESNGLIGQIDGQVLRQVCDEMKPNGKLAENALVCVNLSATHLGQSKSLQHLLAIVKTAGVAGHKLCFVFSEQGLLNQADSLANGFKRIKGLGIQVAIQGFGTGVSSLGLLTQNNLDYVKVDRDFTSTLTKNPKHRTLLETLVTLSLSFGFKVVLDGIDTETLQQLATRYQVAIGQGSFFESYAIHGQEQTSTPQLVLHQFA